MARLIRSSLELLETRIAPATLVNPLPDVVAGIGDTGATFDLGTLFDEDKSYRTIVEFTTNYYKSGIAQKIYIELYDDVAPLSVQNFLSYVTNKSKSRDYDGTIFHRSFDFGSGSGPGRDILQGGGYVANSNLDHIPTGPEVHNEYSSLYPNERGTLAMAKTGLGPNTATSEWFVNVNDNTSILNEENNGGYAVFGRVLGDGMDVIDAIAALSTRNLGGAFTDLPVQNTQGSGLTVDNLIQITDARVVPAEDSVQPGVTYTVEVLSGADLLTSTLNGDMLSLKYKTGVSGVATIKVTAQDGQNTIEEEFTVRVQPNLIVNSVSDTLPNVIVPGDKGSAKVKLTNNGGGLLKGAYDIKFYLSQPTDDDPNGNLITDDDQLVGQVLGKNLNIKSGKSLTVTGQIQVPYELVDEQGSQRRIIAEITPAAGNTVTELFVDDNVMVDGGVSEIWNLVGTLNNSFDSIQNIGGVSQHVGDVVASFEGKLTKNLRQNVSLTYMDANGVFVTAKLSGGGVGILFPDSQGIPVIALANTKTGSVFSMATERGEENSVIGTIFAGNGDVLDASFDSQGLDVNIPTNLSPLAKIDLARVDIGGDVYIYGGARTLTFGDFVPTGNDLSHLFEMGVSTPLLGKTASISMGNVTDTGFQTQIGISSLKALSWENSNASEEALIASRVDSLTITGDLQASVIVTGESRVATFKVGGVVDNALIDIAGSAGTITLGGLSDSTIRVGVETSALPTSLADFTATSKISSFSIVAPRGSSPATMSNSVIAAATIGSVNVQSVDEASGSGNFGFIADVISRYQRGATKLSNLQSPDFYDVAGNYRVQIV